MEQILLVEDFQERLLALHDAIRAAIAGLPAEALDWVPGPEMNSINVLVVHLTAAERYWIGDVVCGETSHRDRDSEFQARGLVSADLAARLAGVEAFIRDHLDTLAEVKLDEYRISPRDGKKFRAFWALAHALDHTALHLGHLQIQRQLWDQRGA